MAFEAAAVVEDIVPEYDDSEDHEVLMAHGDDEMSPEQTAGISPSPPVATLLSWLRLVPSIVHYTLLFYGNPTSSGLLIKRICFDVIDYPKSLQKSIDWEGCIEELLQGRAEEVFANLRNLNPRFTRGMTINFPGPVHYEAPLTNV